MLDAFPRLEVYLPHGGGTFPWLIGRFDYAIGTSAALKHMKQPGSAYLNRFYYDVIVFNTQIMRDLIDLVGVGRIVMVPISRRAWRSSSRSISSSRCRGSRCTNVK